MRNRWLTAVTFALFTAVILGAGAAGAFAAPVNDEVRDRCGRIVSRPGDIRDYPRHECRRAHREPARCLLPGTPRPSGTSGPPRLTTSSVLTPAAASTASVDPLPTDVHVYTGTTVSTLVEVPESYFPGDLLPRGHVEIPVRATFVVLHRHHESGECGSGHHRPELADQGQHRSHHRHRDSDSRWRIGGLDPGRRIPRRRPRQLPADGDHRHGRHLRPHRARDRLVPSQVHRSGSDHVPHGVVRQQVHSGCIDADRGNERVDDLGEERRAR